MVVLMGRMSCRSAVVMLRRSSGSSRARFRIRGKAMTLVEWTWKPGDQMNSIKSLQKVEVTYVDEGMVLRRSIACVAS